MPENASPAELRAVRYLLQRAAAKAVPDHPVRFCLWTLARGAGAVEVHYSPARGRARYRQLATCGSVWACPVCAAHITERRADEVRAALAANTERGGSAAFATFTVSHSHEDALEVVLEGFLRAFRYLTSKPSYKRLRDRYGVVGYVRVLEVTYGRNGWHVHSHAVYLFRGQLGDAAVEAFEGELYPLWESAAAKFGLRMARRYGLRVQRAYGTVEEYLAKFGHGPRWDVARELAKGHAKRGRSAAGLRHLTPWELLAAAASGDGRCGQLFAEFVHRFNGKAQLYWSPGLRDALGLGATLTDSEAAAVPDAESKIAGEIHEDHWPAVRRAGGRSRVLELVEDAGGEWGPAGEFVAAAVEAFPPAPRPAPSVVPVAAAIPGLAELRDDQAERLRWRGPLPVEAVEAWRAQLTPAQLARLDRRAEAG